MVIRTDNYPIAVLGFLHRDGYRAATSKSSTLLYGARVEAQARDAVGVVVRGEYKHDVRKHEIFYHEARSPTTQAGGHASYYMFVEPIDNLDVFVARKLLELDRADSNH